MIFQSEVILLSFEEMVQINGGGIGLPGWIGILSAGYDFLHGFYDGFSGRPKD